MDTNYPLPLSEKQLRELEASAKDHAIANGLLMRKIDGTKDTYHFTPHMLLPCPIPRHCFLQARAVQTDFNTLFHRVANDHDFLHKCFEKIVKVDDFIRRLWDIYVTVRNEGVTQPLSLIVARTDYLLERKSTAENENHESNATMPEHCIKQVEINTVACALSGYGDKVTNHHKYILEELGWTHLCQLPENNVLDGISEAIALAWTLYGQPGAVVLVLVPDDDWNVLDQRFVEYAVRRRNPSIKFIRRSIQALRCNTTLGAMKELIVDDVEVAIVYHRSGYDPSHFKHEQDWSIRLMLERSRAIKCPSIQYFLVNMKKVQQMLTVPGVVQQYLSDLAAVQRVKQTFKNIYSLEEGEDGESTFAMALQNPFKYVVKSQREAGGDKVFGDAIPKFLNGIALSPQRNAYILMERIQAVPYQSYMLSTHSPLKLDTFVAELGVFGFFLGSAEEIVLNKERGHCIRTMKYGVDECSIAKGWGALGSPCLI